MADAGRIRDTVEQLVNEVFATGIPLIRDQVVERVVQQLQPLLPSSTEANRVAQLNAALAAMHGATAQSDVLSALLDGMAVFCSRAALFLLRGGSAVGWQARGFAGNDAIRALAVNLSAGLAERAVTQRAWVAGPAMEFESRLTASFGPPRDGTCQVAPLIVRERIVALIYADGGPQKGSTVDRPGLEALVGAASVWIELLALRKSAVPNAALSSNAAHNAGGNANPAAPDPTPGPAQPATTPPATVQPASAEMEELDRKARRFAKLLVDEIKLYHQDKVAQGRQNQDLYARLKDDIDKSRLSYEKRYNRTDMAGNDYFTEELIRNLADNNPNLLGSSFPR